MNFRRDRIERLLEELRHEISRGLSQNEIDEEMGFEFVYPMSRSIPEGVVHFEARMRPKPVAGIDPRLSVQPRLRMVK